MKEFILLSDVNRTYTLESEEFHTTRIYRFDKPLIYQDLDDVNISFTARTSWIYLVGWSSGESTPECKVYQLTCEL